MKKLLLFIGLLLLNLPVFAEPVSLNFDNGIYCIKLNGNKIKKQIQFITSDKLKTNKEIHKANNSLLTINTGFFDTVTGETVSYVITDGQITADPSLNEDLLNNKNLKPYMDKILNRSEFRIIRCKKRYYYEIAPHNTPVKCGCEIITSAQGGPQILPELRLEEEFFVLKENDRIVRESASVLHKTARTVIGIKNKKNAYILIITNNNPKTMEETQQLCKKLKLKSAMAFDGGTSTSLSYNDLHYVASYSLKGRLLKSFMIIKK